MSIEDGANRICYAIKKALRSDKGLLVGRLGTVEYEVVSGHASQAPWKTLERNAGIFPCPAEGWRTQYMTAIQAADVLATGWYAPMAAGEQRLLEELGWKGEQVKLRSLEPYYVEPVDRWTQLLENQDVCVVSAFSDTIRRQVQKGYAGIWGPLNGLSLLPSSTRWSFVKTGYAPSLAQGRATWMEAACLTLRSDEEINSWEDAVKYMEEAVLATNAKIVLIGCGGMGMILAERLKRAGKICIVMGGAIQVLFGVKGMRWKSHEVISRFWNTEWVWPSIEETPAGALQVEGACYWSSR